MNSPKRANIFSLALILFSVFVSLLISLAVVKFNIDVEKAELVLIIVQDLFIFLLPILAYCVITKTNLFKVIPHEKLSFKNILYIILLTILISPLITVVSSITTIFYSPDVNTQIYSYIIKLPTLLSLFAMAVMPALFEELAFRGIILSNYKSAGLLKSALVSGLFFGLFHMDFYQIGYAVLAGVFFTFIVSYTNSIYASVFSHFLINGTQVLYAKLVLSIMDKYQIMELLNQESQTGGNYQAIVSGIFFTLVSTPFLLLVSKKFMEHNKNHKLDYDLSIQQKEPEEFEINIDSINTNKNNKKGFIDIFFISYVIVAIIFSLIFSIK